MNDDALAFASLVWRAMLKSGTKFGLFRENYGNEKKKIPRCSDCTFNDHFKSDILHDYENKRWELPRSKRLELYLFKRKTILVILGNIACRQNERQYTERWQLPGDDEI